MIESEVVFPFDRDATCMSVWQIIRHADFFLNHFFQNCFLFNNNCVMLMLDASWRRQLKSKAAKF